MGSETARGRAWLGRFPPLRAPSTSAARLSSAEGASTSAVRRTGYAECLINDSGHRSRRAGGPRQLVTLATGLTAKVVSEADGLGGNIDQMVPWPDDVHPTHLIACNEEGTAAPGIQRIRLSDGAVETILTGLNRCDPTRKSPWGTIIAAEENSGASRVIEILDPLHTTDVVISGNTLSGADASHVAIRTALGAFSFEGFAIFPNGVAYYCDENRPGTGGLGNPGGSQMKFIPSALWTAGNPPIVDFSQSPFVSGRVFGLRIGRNSSNTDVGQGNEFGRGNWVEIIEGQTIRRDHDHPEQPARSRARRSSSPPTIVRKTWTSIGARLRGATFGSAGRILVRICRSAAAGTITGVRSTASLTARSPGRRRPLPSRRWVASPTRCWRVQRPSTSHWRSAASTLQ